MVFWQRLEQWMTAMERAAVVVSFAVLLFLGALQVILRNVFASVPSSLNFGVDIAEGASFYSIESSE